MRTSLRRRLPLYSMPSTLGAAIALIGASYAAPTGAQSAAVKSVAAKPVAPKLTTAPSTTSVQKKVAVRGTVLGFNDKPVATAVVAVRGWSALPEGPAQTLKTDALGKFSALVVPPIRSGTDIVGRAIIVAPGFAAASEPLKSGDNVLRLRRGRTASGIVTDSAGKPVAGARVRLSGVFWREPLNLLSLDDPSELEESYAVQSGVDGRWKLDGLPTSGEAMFLLDDAKYVQHWTRLDLETDTTVAPLVAKPGSGIAGRVLASNGKPLPHAKVSAQGAGDGGGHASTVTAGDGRYLLKGLPTGTFTITVQDASGASVTPPLKGVKTKLGQTAPVSDIKMGLGIVVEGTVIDARTEQPLSSARIGAQGPHGFSVSTPSDAKGRYAVRVVPGDISFYMYDIPPGYLRERVSSHKVSIAATRKQVAPFRLQKGRTLTGTAVDESGQPAVGAIIGSGSSYEDAQAAVDKNGTWNMIGIRHSDQVRLTASGEWQIISPKTVKISAAGPVNVVLRRIKLATLRGRVVAPGGEPVQGVRLRLHISINEQNNSYTIHDKVSGSDGGFSLSKLRPDQATIRITAQKEGYKFDSGGAVTLQDGNFVSTDVVMSPLSATFAGRVLDASGAAAAGARAIVPGTLPLHVVTADASGRFTIEGLPPGALTVMAARGNNVGESRGEAVTVGERTTAITLKERQPPPVEATDLAAAILQELEKSDDERTRKSVPYLARYLGSRDPDRALQFVTLPDGTLSDRDLEGIIGRLARRDPARAALWAPAQLEKFKNNRMRLHTALFLGLQVVDTAPDVARALLKSARAMVKTDDFTETGAHDYSHLAALAARLNERDANKLTDLAVIATERVNGPKAAEGRLGFYAEVVAEGGADLVRRLISDMNAVGRVRALERAIPVVARRDVKAAQALLTEMEADMRAAASTPAEPQSPANDAMYRPTSDQSFAAAAYAVVKALGPSDPAAALALARRTKETPYIRYSKANMLALAAGFQSPTVALQVLREAMEEARNSSHPNAETAARIAMLTYKVDAAAGEAMFAQVKEKIIRPLPAYEEDEMRPTIAPYAFYYSAIDPAQSRLLIESEWMWRTTGKETSNRATILGLLSQAMATIDVERALEMSQSLPETYGERGNVRGQIIKYVLAPEAVRRVMYFEEYSDPEE